MALSYRYCFPGSHLVRSWTLSPQLARFHEALSSVEGRTPRQYLEKKHLGSVTQTSVISEETHARTG